MAKKQVAPKIIRPSKPKFCFYCQENCQPIYTDSATLKKFVSDRFKILPQGKSGLCSKHQRRTAREIKHARHLALLPFIARV